MTVVEIRQEVTTFGRGKESKVPYLLLYGACWHYTHYYYYLHSHLHCIVHLCWLSLHGLAVGGLCMLMMRITWNFHLSLRREDVSRLSL